MELRESLDRSVNGNPGNGDIWIGLVLVALITTGVMTAKREPPQSHELSESATVPIAR